MSNRCNPCHLEEHRLLEECEHTEEHWAQSDLDWYGRTRPCLTDDELNRMGRWTKSTHPRLVVTDEVRQFRILKLAEQPVYTLVNVGTPRYPEKDLGKPVSPRVMPTAQEHQVKIDRDGEVEHVKTPRMRLSCTKWERLARPKLPRGGRTSSGIDYTALADMERRLGIKLD